MVSAIEIYEVYKVIRRDLSEERALGAVAALRRATIVALDESLALEAADVSLARTQRDAAMQISDVLAEDRGPDDTHGKVYFAGHWGFQHYMQLRGAAPLDKRRTLLSAGDIVILPENNTALIGLPLIWLSSALRKAGYLLP